RPGPRGSRGGPPMNPADYFADELFRSNTTTTAPDMAQPAREEAKRILIRAEVTDELTAPDRAYLSHLVAARTDLSPAEADGRVNEVLAQMDAAKNKAKQAADKARKALATFAIINALAMVIGAFVAAAAAALGGHLRDE